MKSMKKSASKKAALSMTRKGSLPARPAAVKVARGGKAARRSKFSATAVLPGQKVATYKRVGKRG